jgi:Zn finger protein HypA/HybF involved in hydrogenase expression
MSAIERERGYRHACTPAPYWEKTHRQACVERRKKMAETYKGDAYCVKCKEKREFEGTVKVSESGRRMAQGICPVCGTKVNRILGKA